MKIISFLLTISLLFCKLEATTAFERGSAPWGADCELATSFEANMCALQKSGLAYRKTEKTESEKPKLTLRQKSCRAMIRFFQVYISAIDGPRSSFYPTSSQYTFDAISKYGVLKGIALGCDRLMRENGEMWVYPTIDKFGAQRKYDPVH